MNTIQNSQLKRSIRVRDFLDDFHAGMTDEALLEKYHLTPTGLERFYDMLQDRGIIDPEELLIRYSESAVMEREPADEGDTTSFICPSCLASHKTMFDICPDCGVSFQDMIRQEEPQAYHDVPDPSVATEDLMHADARAVDRSKVFESSEPVPAIEIPQEPESAHDFFVDPSEMREHDQFCWPGEIDFDRAANEEFVSADDAEFGNPGSVQSASQDAFGSEDLIQDSSLISFREGIEPRESDSSDGTSQFDASLDEFDSTPRFEGFLEQPQVEEYGQTGTLCESCDEIMEPTLRDVYDRKRSHLALILAGACLVLGFLGSAAVSLFDGYSLGRLFVVYTTGMCLLFGAILSSVGAFMYLAREKVYFCNSCRRVYPRG